MINWNKKFDEQKSYGKTPLRTLFGDLPKETDKSEGEEETAQKVMCYEAGRIARDKIMSMATRQRKSFGIHERRTGIGLLFEDFAFVLSRLIENDPALGERYYVAREYVCREIGLNHSQCLLLFMCLGSEIYQTTTYRELGEALLKEALNQNLIQTNPKILEWDNHQGEK